MAGIGCADVGHVGSLVGLISAQKPEDLGFFLARAGSVDLCGQPKRLRRRAHVGVVRKEGLDCLWANVKS